jgi:hypothetical protein
MDLKETPRAIIFTFVRLLTHPLRKVITVIRLGGTSSYHFTNPKFCDSRWPFGQIDYRKQIPGG